MTLDQVVQVRILAGGKASDPYPSTSRNEARRLATVARSSVRARGTRHESALRIRAKAWSRPRPRQALLIGRGAEVMKSSDRTTSRYGLRLGPGCQSWTIP